MLASQRAAAPQAYTDSAAFLAALPGVATTVDFDAVAAGTTIASGGSIDGLTLTYSLGGTSLAITDGTSFGAAPSAASATSSPNFLGTDDADHLQDGDAFTLSFVSGKGIGLFVLTRDAMEDGDVTLTAGGATASLLAAAVEQTLADGSAVYFLGVLEPAGGVASAVMDYPSDSETNFLINVDDVILVPEPAQLLMLLAGAAGLAGLARLRRADRIVSKQQMASGVNGLSEGGMVMSNWIPTSVRFGLGMGVLFALIAAPQDAPAQRLSLADLQADVAALQGETAKIDCISPTSDADDVYFNGCNVHVQDGSGSSGNPPFNGKGNLIIGYNEDNLVPTPKDRTGSHNLVVGPEHAFSDFGGLVAGFKNTISGAHASVSGGAENNASGTFASVSGGSYNTASGESASVSGGEVNTALNRFDSVSGGWNNTAGHNTPTLLSHSSVSGGSYNTASGFAASVSGGNDNEAANQYSTVSGGRANDATGAFATVSAGRGNEASQLYSTVSGGTENTALVRSSTVSGGRNNIAGGYYSTVSGGNGNTTYTSYDHIP
jgi:hypothetical protein